MRRAKNLAAAYQLLTQNSERQLPTAIFEKLPFDHPARAPYNLFAHRQATPSDRELFWALGTRLRFSRTSL